MATTVKKLDGEIIMNTKLYELMNWPDIEAVVYSELDNPKSLLGGHLVKSGFLIQTYRPDAVTVKVNVEGKKTQYTMEKVDESGFFAVLIPSKKKLNYELLIENVNGERKKISDPYSFENVADESTYKAMHAGEETRLTDCLGSRIMTINGCEGVLFSVWAPEAVSVCVVGDFNKYSSGVSPMERIENSDVFELFIPGLGEGTEYQYEIKCKGSKLIRKLDPLSLAVSVGPIKSSVVSSKKKFTWHDSEYLKARKSKTKRPMTIYEVCVSDWAKKSGKKTYESLAQDLADYVKEQGYTHVQLLPMSEYCNDNMKGYSSVAYYSVCSKFGSSNDFKRMIDTLHRNNIGVLLDWNAAYFGTDSMGLYNFDGADCYGYLKPTLEKDESWDVVTFDYKKGAVVSFLKSNLLMWLDDYHIDGVRIDGVASMLYLDYGKQPSTWQPNIYGGNENLEAIEFIKDVNSLISKRKDGVISIAEESSSWPNVTKVNVGDNLGFDLKLNNCFKKDFIDFISTDPLFRKGEYEKLTYGMLYNYSEDFVVGITYDTLAKAGKSLKSIAFGQTDNDKLRDVCSAIGFIYAHPGAKLVSMCDDEEIEHFLSKLNEFYVNNPAMFECDDESLGFVWLENSNANETVIAFARKDSKGNELTCVFNFTPVDRVGYRLPVLTGGKYKEVFNSSMILEEANQDSSNVIKSDNEDKGDKDFIDINLPASSMLVFECTPYSDIELEEISIIKKGAVAKKEAEDRAIEAKRLEAEAEIMVEQALEAKRKAEDAAKQAILAKEEAKKKASEAAKISRNIDLEVKKKLAELNKKKVNE